MSEESSQIKLLRARYRLSMGEKSAELKELVELASHKQPLTVTDQELVNVKEYLHKLAGSSGMYGYTDIARLARSIMEFVEQQQVDIYGLRQKASALSDLLEHHTKG